MQRSVLGFLSYCKQVCTEEKYFASMRKLGFDSPQSLLEPSSISGGLSSAVSDLC